ncbi:Rhodanese-related sulfurtransferase [Flavobacteriaceae bacterium MAR_2010_188]|nr:Rhodanese-related sulfurtransferase [Flavobacteriaceae bacterium MAR_2010_188]
MGLFDFVIDIRIKKLKRYIANGAVLLDVRNKDEIKNGKIEGSLNIPFDDLQDGVDELKKMKKPIIVHCESGGRSAKAAQYLTLNNIDAVNGGSWKNLKKLL